MSTENYLDFSLSKIFLSFFYKNLPVNKRYILGQILVFCVLTIISNDIVKIKADTK